ncbi:MAG: hypothetical protein IPO78_17255 [Saprospiraceae bacterium]|nr:hypothetical protein [Saprospiraceae bacterium]
MKKLNYNIDIAINLRMEIISTHFDPWDIEDPIKGTDKIDFYTSVRMAEEINNLTTI